MLRDERLEPRTPRALADQRQAKQRTAVTERSHGVNQHVVALFAFQPADGTNHDVFGRHAKLRSCRSSHRGIPAELHDIDAVEQRQDALRPHPAPFELLTNLPRYGNDERKGSKQVFVRGVVQEPLTRRQAAPVVNRSKRDGAGPPGQQQREEIGFVVV